MAEPFFSRKYVSQYQSPSPREKSERAQRANPRKRKKKKERGNLVVEHSKTPHNSSKPSWSPQFGGFGAGMVRISGQEKESSTLEKEKYSLRVFNMWCASQGLPQFEHMTPEEFCDIEMFRQFTGWLV